MFSPGLGRANKQGSANGSQIARHFSAFAKRLSHKALYHGVTNSPLPLIFSAGVAILGSPSFLFSPTP
jgi:hypothetical protein